MINIPDLFQSHPLCSEPDKRLVKASVFVSLFKHPTNKEISPYCFSPAYIVEENQRLKIKGYDAGDESSVLQRYENDGSAVYAEILDVVGGIQH
jgi:hypothetical protein